MSTAFLITFREGLEAAFIIGILLSTLKTLGESKKQIFIWSGVSLGIFSSFLFAYFLDVFSQEFEGSFEKIYEGILMFLGFLMITHVVFWLNSYHKNLKENLKNKLKFALTKEKLIGILTVAFLSVFREGVELVIFLKAIAIQSGAESNLTPALLGIVSSIIFSILIFSTTKRIPIKQFFRFTSYLLLFVAAGLLAHGIVEFQGADILPIIKKPIFDLENILSEKEGFGSFLKAIFGYDANPSLIAVLAYIFYLGIAFSKIKKS